MADIVATLDGTNVTSYVLEGSVTHQHNRPSFATVRMPSFLCNVADDSRLKISLDGSLDFHGAIGMIEDEGDEITAYTTLTFVSPSLLFEFRPARDGAGSGDQGDFSKPGFIARRKQAPQMLKEILEQSIGVNGGIPADAEGPMGIQLGTFASGGVDLSGAPADWPMTIAEIIAMLVETGELDVIETPIDSGGNMALVSAYNGDYGVDRTGSVQFGWKTGERNVRAVSRTLDFREIVNKLWIYLGPRVGTKSDPQGDQHWDANITAQSTFPDPPASSVLAAMNSSRAQHYVRMLIRIFDGDGVSAALDLYKHWWLMETWLRSKPRVFVSMTPERGIKPTFRTGDLIYSAAGTSFRGGFAGPQRVMEYTYRWDTSHVIELGAPLGQAGAPAVVSSYDADGV